MSLITANGQVCTSPNGILVKDSHYNEFKSLISKKADEYNRKQESVDLISANIYPYLNKQINDSNCEDIVMVDSEGFSPVTLCFDPKINDSIFLDESFGPVSWIKPFSSAEDLREVFSINKYRLNVSLFSNERKLLDFLESEFSFARVCFNAIPTFQNPISPWGASGDSGFSRVESLLEKYTIRYTLNDNNVDFDNNEDALTNKYIKVDRTGAKIMKKRIGESSNHFHVNIKYSGLCGTDKKVLDGKIMFSGSQVLGHENVGQIAFVPENNNSNLNIGDHVVWPALSYCKECRYCLNSETERCINSNVYGFGMTDQLAPNVFGGWSKVCYIPTSFDLIKIDFPSVEYVFADPLASALKLINQVKNDSNVLIIGSGALGVSAFKVLSAKGIKAEIIGNDKKLKNCNIEKSKIFDRNKLNDIAIAKYDFVYDTISNTETLGFSINSSLNGATIIAVGDIADSKVSLNISELIKKNVKLEGRLAYSLQDFKDAVSLIESFKGSFSEIPVDIYGMDDFFEKVRSKDFQSDSVKIVMENND